MKMEQKLKWVMIVILALLNDWYCCYGCWEQERIALLQLKAHINHPSGTSLPDWVENKKDANCCNWSRVVCNTTARRVTQLNLYFVRDFNMEDWYFNASMLLHFEKLEELNLSGNQMVGWVENEGFERVSSRLRNLEVLYLFDNHLNNSIVSSLSGLLSLKSLHIGYNRLKGSIQIKDGFSNLEELYVFGNLINKFIIPEGTKSLSKLQVLDLDSYGTNASILLQSLGAFSSLTTLYFRFNSSEEINITQVLRSLSNLEDLILDDSSPNNNFLQYIGGLTSIKVLSLRYCGLNGTLTGEGLCQLKNLEELSLSENDFVGPLPSCLGNMKSLRVLDVSYSQFNGNIALSPLINLEDLILDYSSPNNNFFQYIGGLTSLKVLSLRGCGLNGTLTGEGLCQLKNLEELSLSRNDFVGPLPSCLGNMKSLRVLDVSYNQFNGNIALSLINLTSLEYLSISHNRLQVPISFESFANSSNLKVVLSDNNNLIAETTLQTWSPKFQLKVFSLSNCIFEGLDVGFPNFLYYQYDLRIVDLSHTSFKGMFPAWLLNNNTRLEGLFTRNSSFMEFFQWPSHSYPSISVIDFSYNCLEGQIPKNMSSMFPNLEALNMSRNTLTGEIPSYIGNLSSLEFLDLSDNQLSGVFPKELAIGCSSLYFLKLSNNKLHGELFPSSTTLSGLGCLYLDGNGFEGSIPEILSNNTSLRVLDISNNSISGKLPRWIGNFSNIYVVAMSNNHIEGPIPTEFCKISAVSLDLSKNHLSGSIPTSCFNGSWLRHVYLNNNGLSGPMTRAFDNSSSSSLVTLNLRYNNFSGRIPGWIGKLSSLSFLLLKANHFEGGISNNICQLNQLSILDLSLNHLTGPIPGCLGNLTFLATFYHTYGLGMPMDTALSASYVQKTKLISYSDYDLPHNEIAVQALVEFTTKKMSYLYKGDILNHMSGIDLSCNQLSGKIPVEIGNLSNIRALNLSYNNLIGPIPATFSNLQQIESLDLSNNSLNGSIPPQLVEMTSLGTFSVAHNNLSGPTPDRKFQFGTFEESCYEGNPLLCGPPLNNSCNENESTSPTPYPLDGESEDGSFIDLNVFQVTFVVTYVAVLLGLVAVLYINPYWRRAWFYFIEVCIATCYYFVLDNLCKISNFRNM